MTGPTTLSTAQRRDLRQLAGAAPFALWLALYVDSNTTEDGELTALLARNAGNLQLAAADMLDGLVDGAETIRKLKLEGELEVEFLPVQYAAKSASLRSQVLQTSQLGRRYGPPTAGLAVGRSSVPQAFVLGSEVGSPDRERLGGVPVVLDRDGP